VLSGTELVIASGAAFAAGVVNALAGGGTLISFPALVAIGIPDVTANVTNTVALCPGYFGAAAAQRKDLSGQLGRLRLLVPAGIIGGATGALLLLVLDKQVFHALVPFLILFAAVILAVQNRVRDGITRRIWSGNDHDRSKVALIPVGLSAVYGGYFGAGLSVIVLSVIGTFINDTLTRLNALKQCIALSANVAAAVFFIISGLVLWPVAIVMAAGALLGGAAGGRFSGCINPVLLRWTIVVIGLIVGTVLLVR
jgi:uncharacterized membrane protein YfcA